MTGLDDAIDRILEVAAVVTDLDFKSLEEFDRVVHQPPEVLEKMDAWCKKTHGASGLTEKVKTGEPLAKVEADLISLLDRHFPKKEDKVVLAGNSVGNDRRFIDRYMPAFAKRLHYRLIDVSSFKEVFRQKYGVKFDKKNKHRALDDIYESIAELKAYLNYVQVPPKSPL
jgi:oligoribonuclease